MLQIAKVMTLTAQEITTKLIEQYKDVQVSIEFITPQQAQIYICLLYTSPSPRDYAASRMPSSA